MRHLKHFYFVKSVIDYAYVITYRTSHFFSRECAFHFLFFFIGFIVISLGIPVCFSPSFAKDQKSVLILHSYRPNYQWTDNINHGLADVFRQYKGEVKLHTEYMDIRKGNDVHHFEVLKKFLARKGKGKITMEDCQTPEDLDEKYKQLFEK